MSIYILTHNEPKDLYQLIAKGWDMEPFSELFYGLDTMCVQAGFRSPSPKHCEKRIYEFGVYSNSTTLEHEIETSRPE
jgi:hypothetical protein